MQGETRIALHRRSDGTFPESPESLMKYLKAITGSNNNNTQSNVMMSDITEVKFAVIPPENQYDMIGSLINYELTLIEKNYKVYRYRYRYRYIDMDMHIILICFINSQIGGYSLRERRAD